MLPWRLFWQEGQEHRMRWSLCAKEICFKNKLLRWGAGGSRLQGLGWCSCCFEPLAECGKLQVPFATGHIG